MGRNCHFPAIRGRDSLACLLALALLGANILNAQTISADFGGRSGTTPVVPSGIFSVGGMTSLSDPSLISTMTASGLTQTRVWISLPQIYATSTANFGVLQSELALMQANGIHGLGVIFGTPVSLGAKTCAPPSNMAAWGRMAASVVAYADKNFPGVMRDYEIWNEPELASSLCAADATAEVNAYVSMFAAAASQMHAQAKADGLAIRTGGPGISCLASMGPVYIPAITNNAATAPYVDFVSFHLYLTGLSNIQKGMTWSDLYAAHQAPRGGVQYFYKLIESLVRGGHQPNAATTPIFVSEFNDNWAFALDCCRNSTMYGALWNSVAITDLLNVVYSGAGKVPSQMTYFNAVGNYFCVGGQWNAKMDCNTTGTLYPYPQFYAYRLFASSHYLDLQSGGHMAAGLTPQSTTSGLGATAFYTRWADSVVIVNPTGTSYSAVTVNLLNPGLTPSGATVYVLNQANFRILSGTAKMTAIAKGYAASVAVPAYSTVAVSLK